MKIEVENEEKWVLLQAIYIVDDEGGLCKKTGVQRKVQVACRAQVSGVGLQRKTCAIGEDKFVLRKN